MQRGFTLIELIVVMMLVGILAVYAMPKTTSDFTADNSALELMQAIRYAQQQSMANTAIANSGVTLANNGFSFINASPLTQAWKLLLPTPDYIVTIQPIGNITFDGHGQPSCTGGLSTCNTTSQAIQVTANGNTVTFYLEPYTGYVHK